MTDPTRYVAAVTQQTVRRGPKYLDAEPNDDNTESKCCSIPIRRDSQFALNLDEDFDEAIVQKTATLDRLHVRRSLRWWLFGCADHSVPASC
jgi:hypothetical protein